MAGDELSSSAAALLEAIGEGLWPGSLTSGPERPSAFLGGFCQRLRLPGSS